MTRALATWRWCVVCAVLSLVNSLITDQLYGQAGLRESLERLDRNENGVIEPEEITPLARPYFERLSRSGSERSRISVDRPNEISRIQEVARRYYAVSNGANDRDVRPKGERTVLPLRPKPDELLVPAFGLAEVKFRYTQDDLDFADRTLGDYDRNEDGFIDRDEAARARKWTHRNPFDDDLNKDDRLSRLELSQRYARRRLLEGASNEIRRKDWRTGGEIEPSRREEERRDESQWWREGGSGHWLTASMMGRFDLNRNGRLELQELQSLGIPSTQVDIDRDGELSRDELHEYLTGLQDDAGDFSDGLPGWFYELDTNRDGQVAMNEFTAEWSDEKLQEFASLDTNTDGLLTALEVVRSKAMVGGSYSNKNAEVLPPKKTIISEIEVDEDFTIGDLNVQLSITHSNTGFLDAYLTGPDGQRIELFSEVGGSGDHFDETIFDDQSRFPINKARPPFKGTFLPEGLLSRQPGLGHFNGKNARGVWQLVVRGTRSERFGMLHSWSLIVRPREEMLTSEVAAPAQDGPQLSTAFEARFPSRRPETSSKPESRTDSRAESYRSSSRGDPERIAEEKRKYFELLKSGKTDGDSEEERRKKIEQYKQWIEKQKLKDGKKLSKKEQRDGDEKDRGRDANG
ncbi:MAG: proprotein convertase P-domain-containing protein [Planctomycetes bacterium]|nr:proprotein convertase P-domain-containing protein [Planctomycetota bacterium]